MDKRWIVKEQLTEDFVLPLSRKWNLSPLMIQLLYNRGILKESSKTIPQESTKSILKESSKTILRGEGEGPKAKEKIWEFLRPDLKNLHDPFLMKGMERATQRILKAFSQNEKILIFGDYDVDGITSTTLLLLFLRDLGISAYFYIPQREEEGYGLNKSVVKRIAKKGINLIITCDCGTSSVEEVEYAKSLGLDVIVTDHHRVKKSFPPHFIVINPNQPDCFYPFKKLAGVGVAFKLVQALMQKLGSKFQVLSSQNRGPGTTDQGLRTKIDIEKYLDLVAIGTIADLSPLKDENRILVKWGLERLNNTLNIGLRALIEVSGLANRRINEGRVGFILAPRLNACGRLSLAKKGVRLLLSTSSAEAFKLAKDLSKENTQRQRIEEKMRMEAEELLPEKKNSVIVLSREGWHPGIIGLVASYIKGKYFRPTIIFSRNGEMARGSARSIPEFSIFEALEKCKDLLLSFGGHKMAAGMSILSENIEGLEERMNELARETLSSEDLIPSCFIDAKVNLDELDEKIFEELELLAPYGQENPAPLFLSENVYLLSPPQAVNRGGLKMSVGSRNGGRTFEAIGFGLKGKSKEITNSKHLSIIFTPKINQWNGKKTYQLEIKDWRGVPGDL